MSKPKLQLSIKEIILTAIATLLALGSFVADDLSVVFTILIIAAILLVILCVLHSGKLLYRIVFAVGSILILVLIGWKAYQHVNSTNRVSLENKTSAFLPLTTTQQIMPPNASRDMPQPRPASPQTDVPVADLEVLEFSSLGVIEFRNNTRQTVTILSLECNLLPSDGGDGASTIEAMSIVPKSIKKFNFQPMMTGGRKCTTVAPLSSTWQGEVEEAKRRYGNCLAVIFLLPQGTFIHQIKDHYRNLGAGDLPVGQAKLTINYMLGNDRKVFTVPLAGSLWSYDDCSPH